MSADAPDARAAWNAAARLAQFDAEAARDLIAVLRDTRVHAALLEIAEEHGHFAGMARAEQCAAWALADALPCQTA